MILVLKVKVNLENRLKTKEDYRLENLHTHKKQQQKKNKAIVFKFYLT